MAAPCLSSAVVGTGRSGFAMQAERVPAWNQSSGTRTKTQEQGQKTKFIENVQVTNDFLTGRKRLNLFACSSRGIGFQFWLPEGRRDANIGPGLIPRPGA
jgi:hypothetical protein